MIYGPAWCLKLGASGFTDDFRPEMTARLLGVKAHGDKDAMLMPNYCLYHCWIYSYYYHYCYYYYYHYYCFIIIIIVIFIIIIIIIISIIDEVRRSSPGFSHYGLLRKKSSCVAATHESPADVCSYETIGTCWDMPYQQLLLLLLFVYYYYYHYSTIQLLFLLFNYYHYHYYYYYYHHYNY